MQLGCSLNQSCERVWPACRRTSEVFVWQFWFSTFHFDSELLFETPPVHSLTSCLPFPKSSSIAVGGPMSCTTCLVSLLPCAFNFSAVIVTNWIAIPLLANFHTWICHHFRWDNQPHSSLNRDGENVSQMTTQEIVLLLAVPEAIVTWASRIMQLTVSMDDFPGKCATYISPPFPTLVHFTFDQHPGRAPSF